MKLAFTKMQGAGNDFIVIDNRKTGFSKADLSQIAKEVCQRKISLGADALMAVDFPQETGDFRMLFFNADGTEAEMCGNGARCIARYSYENQISPEKMVIETIAGNVPAWRKDETLYQVTLNPTTVAEFDQPFGESEIESVDYVELGNPGIPHLVVHYPNLAKTPLKELTALARQLRFWEKLPKGANVNFYELLDKKKQEVLVRTYERGVEDFTMACGTGCGSTAYALVKKGILVKPTVSLRVLGGNLEVIVEDDLQLIGEAVIVAEGWVTADTAAEHQ